MRNNFNVMDAFDASESYIVRALEKQIGPDTNCGSWSFPAVSSEVAIIWEGVQAVRFDYSISGEQEDDKPYCGSKIWGTAVFHLRNGFPEVFVETRLLDSEEDEERGMF
jgi:hypothetical protein